MSTDGDPQTFGERLRAARDEAGLTQEETARRVGVTLRAYAAWELGRNEPRGASLIRLGEVLEIDPRELYPTAVEAA